MVVLQPSMCWKRLGALQVRGTDVALSWRQRAEYQGSGAARGLRHHVKHEGSTVKHQRYFVQAPAAAGSATAGMHIHAR